MNWKDKIRDPGCTLCPLHEGAEFVCLMGSGSRKSKIMIVGEAPGAREDEQHAAFVGPAGKLLDSLLAEVGIAREDCYITNAVKCRPPGNRSPTRSEAKICQHTYLTEEVGRVQPASILALGNTALQATTGRSGITKWRGKVFGNGSGFTFSTFHPAFALRSPRFLPALRADFAAFARLHGGDTKSTRPRVRIIKTRAQLKWLVRQLEAAKEVSFDLETDGLEEWRDGAEIVTVGFTWEPNQAAVLPVFHPAGPWRDPKAALLTLKRVLEGHPYLIAHHGKFDARWFAAAGIFVRVRFDTMLAAHMLDENYSKGLEPLAELHLGADSYKLGDAIKDPKSIPIKKLCIYNGTDTSHTLGLKQLFAPRLKAEPRVARLFTKLIMPASNALTHIERGGIWVDEQRLVERTERAVEVLRKLTEYMDRSSGGINYNSPQQVAAWLFGELGLPIVKETPTGAASTAEGVLFELESESKYVKALLKYRKWHKWLTTYLLPWDRHRDRRSRIHTSYLLHGTVTGRISSRGPNLQQVPRDPFIRSILGAPPGWVFMEADYSQIELRLAAMTANEREMLCILASGEDMHTATAVSILRKMADDISKDERVIWGKHPNFGLLYGMGPGSEDREGGYYDYCKQNGHPISIADAELTYRRFHEAYPRLRAWHNREKRLAERYGRVQNALGRVRHLPDMRSSDKSVRAEAERQAINFKPQSLASDLMLVSLVRLEATLSSKVARIVTTTHDSLGFEVRDEAVDEVAGVVRDTMQDMDYVEKVFGAQITVPIVAEVEVGSHWGEGEEWQ